MQKKVLIIFLSLLPSAILYAPVGDGATSPKKMETFNYSATENEAVLVGCRYISTTVIATQAVVSRRCRSPLLLIEESNTKTEPQKFSLPQGAAQKTV